VCSSDLVTELLKRVADPSQVKRTHMGPARI
jgi:hypothetical protein